MTLETSISLAIIGLLPTFIALYRRHSRLGRIMTINMIVLMLGYLPSETMPYGMVLALAVGLTWIVILIGSMITIHPRKPIILRGV